MLTITSSNSGQCLEIESELGITMATEIAPMLEDMQAPERIYALALNIALAAEELEGLPNHSCLDAVKADLMGEVVRQVVTAGFEAVREGQKAAPRRPPHLRLVPS